MIERFLKAKHWQLFLLIFGIPLLFQVFFIISIFTSINLEGQPDPLAIVNPFKFFPIIMILYMGTYFGWFWSIANGLQKTIPVAHRLKLTKFRLFFFIPLIYITSICIFMSGFLNSLSTGSVTQNQSSNYLIPVIIVLHLFSMFCMFYQLYFVSKTIKTAALKREVTFSDYLGEFFMMWFFPFGIWIIQPKINKIVSQGFIDGIEVTN